MEESICRLIYLHHIHLKINLFIKELSTNNINYVFINDHSMEASWAWTATSRHYFFPSSCAKIKFLQVIKSVNLEEKI